MLSALLASLELSVLEILPTKYTSYVRRPYGCAALRLPLDAVQSICPAAFGDAFGHQCRVVAGEVRVFPCLGELEIGGLVLSLADAHAGEVEPERARVGVRFFYLRSISRLRTPKA